ncbi:DUF4183 domain-containing protein [Bacillus sp. 3103sda1]|uniref:DUF4183 domain-containing protein n=1 Tax=Bacillus sp. 3103sda1 TaxID=2953808 RepID=UPI0020A0240E|nr:DUF4183 domain-containing protein [Bacillus sp. 3103sda1]MCP1122557.1 DUF4183 domain-containing protein [Bacillus sp. 3103sda1]
MPIIKPFFASKRYNSTIGAGTGIGSTFTILATDFKDDTGAAATAFPASFVYYNLYLNGQLQPAINSSVTKTAITIPSGDILDRGVPVMIEFGMN